MPVNVMSARWKGFAEQRIPLEGIGAKAMVIENGTEKAPSRHINKEGLFRPRCYGHSGS